MGRCRTIFLSSRKSIPTSRRKPENLFRGLLTLVPPRFSSIPSVVQSASRSAKRRDFRLTTTEDEKFSVPRQRHRVVLLVGFMGAGKTSVGRMLAEQLHWRF